MNWLNAKCYSTLDLPAGMPKPVYKHLRNVWVCGRKLEISIYNGNDAQGKPAQDKPVRSFKDRPKAGKPRKKSAGKSAAKPHRKGPGKAKA